MSALRRPCGATGFPAMVVRDREGHTADFKLAKLDNPNVQDALWRLIDPESVLRSDGDGVRVAFARNCGITHRVVHGKPGQRVRGGAFHLQNVNVYHHRLKNWIVHFHGAATRPGTSSIILAGAEAA